MEELLLTAVKSSDQLQQLWNLRIPPSMEGALSCMPQDVFVPGQQAWQFLFPFADSTSNGGEHTSQRRAREHEHMWDVLVWPSAPTAANKIMLSATPI